MQSRLRLPATWYSEWVAAAAGTPASLMPVPVHPVLAIQFLADVSGRVEKDGSSTWNPIIHIGVQDGVPDPWLRP